MMTKNNINSVIMHCTRSHTSMIHMAKLIFFQAGEINLLILEWDMLHSAQHELGLPADGDAMLFLLCSESHTSEGEPWRSGKAAAL